VKKREGKKKKQRKKDLAIGKDSKAVLRSHRDDVESPQITWAKDIRKDKGEAEVSCFFFSLVCRRCMFLSLYFLQSRS